MIHLLLTKSLQTYKRIHRAKIDMLKCYLCSKTLVVLLVQNQCSSQKIFSSSSISWDKYTPSTFSSSEKVILYIKKHFLKPIISFKGSLFFLVKKYGCSIHQIRTTTRNPERIGPPILDLWKNQTPNIEQALNKKQTRFIVNRQFTYIEFEKNNNSEIKNT